MADYKVGLDYFELDCHMEEKIRLIQAEFGLKGFAIVVKLYQKIYGEFGYYCEWSEDSLLLFMSENGVSSSDKNLIKEIVSACIRRNIFSEKLFKNFGILTSCGVQKRYMKATSRREKVSMKKEYLLLSDGKINPNVDIIEDSVGIIEDSVGIIRQSRVENSRVENSRVENACAKRIEEFLSVYPKDCNRYLTEHEYISLLLTGKVTENELVQCAFNYANACGILETPERYIKNAENFLKELVFEKYLPGKYKKPENKKKNKLNNFSQRECDYDELERILLNTNPKGDG